MQLEKSDKISGIILTFLAAACPVMITHLCAQEIRSGRYFGKIAAIMYMLALCWLISLHFSCKMVELKVRKWILAAFALIYIPWIIFLYLQIQDRWILYIAMCFLLTHIYLSARKYKPLAYEKFKPRVVVWERNGITMVAAKEDYELGLQQRDRFTAATGEKTSGRRVRPQMYALFSDRYQSLPNVPDFPTFKFSSIASLERLLAECVSERCEMQMPNSSIQTLRDDYLSVGQLHRLIHRTEPPTDLV